MKTPVISLIPGAQREPFDFTPFKSPVIHGGIADAKPTGLPLQYDVSTEQLLYRSTDDRGGLIPHELNFRGVTDE